VQTRLGVPRETVAGHVSDPRVAERVGRWARAAIGFTTMRSLRLARFGDNMRDVAVTEGDKVEAELRFGVSVNTYGVNDLVERVDAVADARIDELAKEYAQLYRLAPELAVGEVRHESLRDAAGSRPGCGTSSLRVVSGPSPRTSRISAVCVNCPGWPYSG
jgi:L-arabinose isomerase